MIGKSPAHRQFPYVESRLMLITSWCAGEAPLSASAKRTARFGGRDGKHGMQRHRHNDTARKTSIILKTTGHKMATVSVWPAAKANATKLKTLVAKREVSVLKQFTNIEHLLKLQQTD